MSPEQGAAALAPFGISKRQGRFLELVMRHAGVCVPRQYASFAGIVHGQKTRAFFAKLVSRGYASAFECRHNRGRIYHVHHSALYAAIDALNSRHRRPVSATRTTQRLMALDALLTSPDTLWLSTKAELRRHFRSVITAEGTEVVQETERVSRLVDRMRINELWFGIDPGGRTVLLYLMCPGSREDFRRFLGQCASVLSIVPAWTLRLAVPRSLTQAYESYQHVLREEWETPLEPHVVDELIWYFERRRSMPVDGYPFAADPRFEAAARAFRGARFDRLYRRWRLGGAVALSDAGSRAVSTALANGSGRVEYLALNHGYEHLSPVVSARGRPAASVERDTVLLRPSEPETLESIV